MFDLRRWIICRILAVFLCAFFVMEAHMLYAQQSAALADQQTALFKTAREAYFAENHEEAKTVLERLIEDLATIDGQDTFKGETYLLAGATYEKLDLLGPSVKYYCRAKAVLGEGKSIEGLNLKKLKYYEANCAAISGVLAEMEGQTDELVMKYNQARIGYFAGATEAAKATLESLITSLGAVDGRDTFKGQVYLFAGAVYEVLEFRELAIKYYCRAKAILGEGVTIEGVRLDDLKFYREPCGGAAVAGTAVKTAGRKKSWFGGLFGTLLGLALVGGLVWYLFFSKNAPLGKKGKYKSITFRVAVTYKGFNSKGHRKFTIGNEVKNDENFIYPQFINSDTACSAATKEENYSYTYTLSGDSVVMKQDWLDWDYVSIPASGAMKKICADYTVTVEKYEYESGKDPGKPSAEGLENLQVSDDKCTIVTNRIKNCSMTATITFKAPVSASAARGVSSTYVDMNDKY